MNQRRSLEINSNKRKVLEEIENAVFNIYCISFQLILYQLIVTKHIS